MANGRGQRSAVVGALLAGMTLWGGCGPVTSEVPERELPLAQDAQRNGHGVRTSWVRYSVGGTLVITNGVTTDRDEASTIVGYYEGAPDFGRGPLPPMDLEFGSNAFIAKYARDGQLLWAHGFPASLGPTFPFMSFENVVADRERNLTVQGFVATETPLGGFTLEPGTFLAQFSPKGEVRWVRSLEGDINVSSGLAVDHDGNIILAGAVFGTVDLGGGPRTASPSGAFFAKYTRSGEYLVDRVLGMAATSHFGGVATDEDGYLYLSGTFFEASNFGGGTLYPPAPGVETAVAARYSPSGDFVWARTLKGLKGASGFRDVAVHGNRVVVGGDFSGRFSFDGRTFQASSSGSSGMVLAMTRDGEDRWGRRLGFGVTAVESDLEDDMTVLGIARPGDNVGTGPLPPASGFYSFISRFERVDGDRKWVRVFEPSASGIARLSVARHGAVTAVGGFAGPVDFGTGVIEPSPPGTLQAFIFRMK